MKGAFFHYSRVLVIILSEEDGRIGNVSQKALTEVYLTAFRVEEQQPFEGE